MSDLKTTELRSTDRRTFLRSAALLSSVFLMGARVHRVEAGSEGVRMLVTLRRRAFGLKFTSMKDGRSLVTVRALDSGGRHAYSYNSTGRAAGRLVVGGTPYRVAASRGSFQTDYPGVAMDPPEGDAPQTQMFRGILIGLAAVITAIVGGEVEIENANGSKVTIKSNGAGGSEASSEEGGEGSSGESAGYRAEPGVEEDPGVWY